MGELRTQHVEQGSLLLHFFQSVCLLLALSLVYCLLYPSENLLHVSVIARIVVIDLTEQVIQSIFVHV